MEVQPDPLVQGMEGAFNMTKVYCADSSCEFNDDHGVCTQKKIALSYQSVMTVWDGRQEYHRCRMYQQSKHSREIEAFFKKKMEEHDEDHDD